MLLRKISLELKAKYLEGNRELKQNWALREKLDI